MFLYMHNFNVFIHVNKVWLNWIGHTPHDVEFGIECKFQETELPCHLKFWTLWQNANNLNNYFQPVIFTNYGCLFLDVKNMYFPPIIEI